MKDEKLSDCWQTPQWLFDELNKEFNFDIDLCATEENSKVFKLGLATYCEDYLTTPLNILEMNCAFMNPPYSNPKPFIEKAWDDSRFCKIVCLVKCDPSTRWWATFWDYSCYVCQDCADCEKDKYLVKSKIEGNETELCIYCNTPIKYFHMKYYRKGPKPGCDYKFFPRRIKFDPPQQLIDSGEAWLQGIKWCSKCMTKEGQLIPIKNCAECQNKHVHRKWVQKCINKGCRNGISIDCPNSWKCPDCKGKGYTELSGPTFSCALVIFDRRNL